MRHPLYLRSALSVVSVWLLQGAPSFGSWPTDPGVNAAVSQAGWAQGPVVGVEDGTGGSIFVWVDQRNTSGQFRYDLFAARILADGQQPWTAEGVAVSLGGKEDTPYTVSDGEGGAIVVWTSGRGSFSGTPPDTNKVHAQRIGGNGTLLWGSDPVLIANRIPTVCAPQPCVGAQAISDGAGGAIVVWEDARAGNGDVAGNRDIYVQRLDGDGNILWSPGGVSACSELHSQRNPRLVPDGFGGGIVVWTDHRNSVSTGGPDVFAQRIDAGGNVLWGSDGTPVCDVDGSQDYPSLAPDGAGGAIVTWYDAGEFNGSYAQRIDANGNTLWITGPEGGVVYGLADHQVRMLPDGAGGAVLIFQSGPENLYAQRLNLNGNVQWGTNGVSVRTGPGELGGAHAIPDGLGGVIITWHDDQSGLGAPDIYAQRLNANGAPLWVVNGVALSTAPQYQTEPFAVPGASSSAIVAWSDGRNGRSDIFAQAIRGDGQLGDTVTDTQVLQQRLDVNFSNPCRSGVDFRYVLPLSSTVTLRLFDVAGRERMMETLGKRPAGTYLNSWDLRGLPAGLYVLRVEVSGSSRARKLVMVH